MLSAASTPINASAIAAAVEAYTHALSACPVKRDDITQRLQHLHTLLASSAADGGVAPPATTVPLSSNGLAGSDAKSGCGSTAQASAALVSADHTLADGLAAQGQNTSMTSSLAVKVLPSDHSKTTMIAMDMADVEPTLRANTDFLVHPSSKAQDRVEAPANLAASAQTNGQLTTELSVPNEVADATDSVSSDESLAQRVAGGAPHSTAPQLPGAGSLGARLSSHPDAVTSNAKQGSMDEANGNSTGQGFCHKEESFTGF